MKFIKTKRILCIVLLSFLLNSCGSQKTSAPEAAWNISNTGGNMWEIADTTYLNSDIYLSCCFAQNNSFIYISSGSEEYYIHQISFDSRTDHQWTETMTLLEIPQIDGQSRLCPLKICPDGSDTGTFWGLWKLFSDDGIDDCYALVKHDLNGGSILTATLNNSQVTSVISDISSIAVLNNVCYLLTEEQLIIITTDGSLCTIEETDSQNRMQLVMAGEKLYLAETSSDEETVLHMLSDDGLSAEKLELPLGGTMFYAGNDDKLYLSEAAALFECDPASMTADCILEWSDSGIRSDCLRAILMAASGQISVLHYDGGYTIRTLRPSDTADSRITLTVVANQYDSNVIKFTAGFNEANPNYKIKIIDPGYSQYDDEELQTRIQLMLISDDCPDVIDLSHISNWESFAENDAFEDMSEFSASGSTVSTEDYLPNILKLGEASGKQIFFPYAFRIEMLYGQEQYVGADLNWSFADMLDCHDRYPDIPLFNMSSDHTLEYLIRMGMDMFVSDADGTCSFEQEMFYRILRISAATEYTPPEDYTNFEFYDEITDERALLGFAKLTIPEFYLLYQSAVPLSSGDTASLAMKGIPSVDGQIGAWLSTSGPCYAIASNSDNKEGAWAFIEYVLSCDPESVYLPARTDKLQSRLQNIRPDILGGGYKIGEWTEAYTENFYAIIENAHADNTDDVICQIVSEEAQYYFNGVKTEQEAAHIIQNRVQLYLSE